MLLGINRRVYIYVNRSFSLLANRSLCSSFLSRSVCKDVINTYCPPQQSFGVLPKLTVGCAWVINIIPARLLRPEAGASDWSIKNSDLSYTTHPSYCPQIHAQKLNMRILSLCVLLLTGLMSMNKIALPTYVPTKYGLMQCVTNVWLTRWDVQKYIC